MTSASEQPTSVQSLSTAVDPDDINDRLCTDLWNTLPFAWAFWKTRGVVGRTWHTKGYFVKRVLKQNQQRICAACAVLYLVEFVNSRRKKTRVAMSLDWFIESGLVKLPKEAEDTEKKEDTKKPEDIKIGDLLIEVQKRGKGSKLCLDEKGYSDAKKKNVAPTLESFKFRARPRDYTASNFIDVLITKLEKGPFITAMTSWNEFRHYKTALGLKDPECYIELPANDPDEGKETVQERRHAILVVGYRTIEAIGRTDFLVKNSWSDTWGSSGYAWIRVTEGQLRMDFGKETHEILFQ